MMWLFKFIAIVFAAAAFQQAEAACRLCNANKIACVSRREFQFCYNDVRNTSVTFECPKPTQICTKFSVVCIDTEEAENVQPDCDEKKVCGVCAGVADGGFTCTSRTTFAMCSDEKLTKQSGKCPADYVCDPSRKVAPCVDSCDVDKSTLCNGDAPGDVTTTTTTTSSGATTTTAVETTAGVTPRPTPSPQPPGFVCKSSGRFPFNDITDCSGYLHCFWQSGLLRAVPLSCPEGTYFNESTTVCVRNKPSWCA